MSLDYSSGADAHYSSTRRIVLISAFLTLSIAAFGIFHTNGQRDSEPASIPVSVATETAPAPSEVVATHVDRYDDIVQTAVNEALRVPEASEWTKVGIKSGQTLSDIFDSLDIPADDWIALTKLGGDAAQLKKLKAGDQLNIRMASGRMQELSYALDETRTLNVRRGDRGLEASTLTASLDRRASESAGMIRSSLFLDAHRAGLSDRLILEFADIFGYDIDFAQDLQQGDHFSVVYEQMFKNGKKVCEGDILAAEFVNQGHRYRAVRYVDADGHAIYYTPEGQSLRKAFIRTPVDFARISSPFNLHRMHPILNIIRAHKGVDYAAAKGTPVHATGDGKVEFIGKKSGYGNVLMIRHGPQYETVYGHLSRFASGLREGAKIRQGQVVAFVGMTGLATAPHLHYEFRVNGIHQNPVTVALPRANPLSSRVLAQFRSRAEPLVAQLDSISASKFAKLDATDVSRR